MPDGPQSWSEHSERQKNLLPLLEIKLLFLSHIACSLVTIQQTAGKHISVLQSPSTGVKWTELEAYQPSPNTAEINNECSYTFSPPYVFLAHTGTILLSSSTLETHNASDADPVVCNYKKRDIV
jgi:hypothetical protein